MWVLVNWIFFNGCINRLFSLFIYNYIGVLKKFAAQLLGLPLIPAFSEASPGQMLHGVNYASAAAGILDITGRNFVCTLFFYFHSHIYFGTIYFCMYMLLFIFPLTCYWIWCVRYLKYHLKTPYNSANIHVILAFCHCTLTVPYYVYGSH